MTNSSGRTRSSYAKEIVSWCMLALFLCSAAFAIAPNLSAPTARTIHIGVSGPLSGPDAALGKAMVDGIRTYADHVNFSGALGDIRLALDIRDDGNDPEKAAEIARAFVAETDVLAVIGPFDDSASIAAADIYKDGGLPAITGASGVSSLTSGNDWVFRVGLTAELQAKLFVNYLGRVQGEETLSIIHETGMLGDALKLGVEDELSILKRTGKSKLKLKNAWAIDPDATEGPTSLKEIVSKLSKSYGGEVIFLAVGRETAMPLIRGLKDNPRRRFGTPVPYRLVGPDTLSDPRLVDAFSELRREHDRPGIYTEGMTVVTPYLDDVSNQSALEFRRRFERRFYRLPDATAAGFRDTAAVIGAAVSRLSDTAQDLSATRQAVRDQIAGRNDPETAVQGATGAIYFDRDGNATKPVTLGTYTNRRLVSPPVQLRPIFARDVVNPRDLIQIHGGYFNPTRILHTGIEIDEISEIDIDARRFRMDFHIWFRYVGDPILEDIEFQNAESDLTLDAPIETRSENGINYSLYRLSGVFKSDFIVDDTGFGQSVLGLRLRHRTLNRDSLIIAPDFHGMQAGGLDKDALERRILSGPDQSWAVIRADLFQDVEPIAQRGNPSFGNRLVDGFSRLNLSVVVEPTSLSLRGILDPNIAIILTLACGILLSILGVIANRRDDSDTIQRLLWFPQTILYLIIMISAEEILVSWMTARQTPPYYIETAIIGFRILWWMLPAWLVAIAIERFIWRPLEIRTGRGVPGVVRGFFSGIVYMGAALGVMAFVFDQKITSLLATSGVLAMIIGLAIQMNLSNIFSGIAINIEKPFRIDDWIKVSGFEPGKVINMTWRTTRIETLDHNIICIPNSVASDSTVENLSYPREYFRSELAVHVDPGARPEWFEKILMDAALSAQNVLRTPGPVVIFQGVQEWSAEYHVRFYCEDYPASIDVEAAVWRDIVRNLRYAGFESVIHDEFTLFHLKEGVDGPKDMAPVLLSDVEVFEPFGRNEQALICKTLTRRRLEEGDLIVRQGEAGDSLFIVAEGALKVEISVGEDDRLEVARLGVGDFFGEMALLTGEPRSADISALTKCVVLEIDRQDVLPIIQGFPDIVNELSYILSRRTIENLRKRKAHERQSVDRASIAEKLFARISGFFELGNTPAMASDSPSDVPADDHTGVAGTNENNAVSDNDSAETDGDMDEAADETVGEGAKTDTDALAAKSGDLQKPRDVAM